MSRVDAHHHVWALSRGDYGWLQPTPSLAPIYRDFAITDLRPLLAAVGIDATILVQAAPTLAETRFLLARAAGPSEAWLAGPTSARPTRSRRSVRSPETRY
jgi:L-fuconolactonase